MAKGAAETLLAQEPVLVAHAPFTARRLHSKSPQRRPGLFDILELFAFVRPAQFCLPTVKGLAQVLNLGTPVDLEDEVTYCETSAVTLLEELAHPAYPFPAHARRLAHSMGRAGWPWAASVLQALPEQSETASARNGLDVWQTLGEWEDYAPHGHPDTEAVEEAEARARLQDLLTRPLDNKNAESRPAQSDYTAAVTHAFTPRPEVGQPNIVLAEAGTGIGKTLGYIAPASLWAEKNGPGTWISTYTKNLQRQIDQELERLYPEPETKRRKAVIRKGRENYLCLLNFQESIARRDPVEMGVIARWILYTRDGDMGGRGLPSLGHVLVSLQRPWPSHHRWLACPIGPHGQARGMHLFCLLPLPQMFYRKGHPACAPCGHRHCQPCVGHGASRPG